MSSNGPFDQIKNIQRKKLSKDFRFGVLAMTAYVVVVSLGIVCQLLVAPPPVPWVLLQFAVGALAGGFILLLLPMWGVAVALAVLSWASITALYGVSTYPFALSETLALFLAPTLQMAHHWEKAVILRFGRFRGLRGPGVFLTLPIADHVTQFVDTRIRATDFSAENTITKDTVPVYVDAIAFWMVWDPQKAVLEVENYVEAIVLSAQTSLRDAIGKNELSSLLE